MSGPTDYKPEEGHHGLGREARAWVVHMRSGEATVDDAASLRAWRDRSPAHSAALSEAIALQRRIKAAGQAMWSSEPLPPRTAPRLSSRGDILKTSHTRRRFLVGAAAASVAGGAMMLSPPFGLWPSLEELNADYRTSAGQRQTLRLADGVGLELNTRTSIDLQRGEQLSFRLIAGEALVSADAGAAILADLGQGRVQAQGAEFLLRLDDDQACVTCVAGWVDVTAHGDTRRLGASEQLRYDARAMSNVSPVETAQALAWRHGLLIFKGEPLDAVVAELNRYHPGRIMLAGDALAATPVNAVFRIDRIDRAVSQIQGFTNASARNLPGGIILLS